MLYRGPPSKVPCRRAENAAAPSADIADRVRIVGARTFVLSNGAWVDTAFDPDSMTAQLVPFLSDAYFKFSQSRPDLGAALALGERVIVVVDGTAYEVVSAEQSAEPLNLPTPLAGQLTPAALPTLTPPTPLAQQPALEPTAIGVEPRATAISPTTTPIPPEPTPAPGQGLGCLGGLLPLALWVGLWVISRRR